MQRLAVQKYFFENLDTVACIFGIVFGILITSLYLISKTIYLFMLGLALTLASLVYFVLKNREKKSKFSIKTSIKLISEIIFFSLFSMSLLVLHIDEDRSFLYFVLISLSAGFLALSILNIKSKIDTALQIVKILMISFILKYSIFFSFKGNGVDYWAHLIDNINLTQYGFIETLSGKEQFFPLMHIQVAIHQIVTNTPIIDATNFAIIIPLVISSICVFLVARKLFDVKIALLAMLIVNTTDYLTCWGSAPQTTTFGVCLFYFLIFLIFQTASSTRNLTPWYIIFIILIPTLILAHAVSSFIFLITIGGLFVGSCVYNKFYDNRAAVIPPILVFLLSGVILFQNWLTALYNEMGGSSFFEVIVSSLEYSLTEQAQLLNRPETIAEYATFLPPFIERAANTVGIALLMLLAAIGCLFWLSEKNRNRFTFSMLTCTILLLIITFGFPLFGIRNIIPTRWFAFMYFFLSIMAAEAVFFLLIRIPEQRLRTFVSVIIIFSLTFFMTTSTISNLDSPIWLKDSTISTSYTLQELKGAETISHYSDETFSDSRYGGSVLGIYIGSQQDSLYSRDLSNRAGSIFIWRTYMEDRPIRMVTTLKGYSQQVESDVILGPEYQEDLERMQQKIYENDDVRGYYIN